MGTKQIITGIYAIIHPPTKRRYIGQSENIYKRWGIHRSCLANKRHHCTYLQNIWNKYGGSCLHFIILEECDIEELDELEDYYMKITPGNKLLNHAKEGGKPHRG